MSMSGDYFIGRRSMLKSADMSKRRKVDRWLVRRLRRDEYVGVHLCLSSPRLEYVGVHLCLSSPRLRKVERSITSHDARSSLWSGIIRGFLASNDAVSSTASLSTTANSSTLPSSSPVPSRLHFVVTTVTNSGTIPTSLHRLSDFALKSLLRLRGFLPWTRVRRVAHAVIRGVERAI